MAKRNYSNYIFLSLVVLLIGSIIYVSVSGKKQDEVFKKEQVDYQSALELIQNQQPGDALELLKPLAEKYPDRYNIQRFIGLAHAVNGDYEKSLLFYERTLDIYPFITEDSLFMLQLGESLLQTGDLENSRIVLEKCKNLAPTIDQELYYSTIEQLLAQINQ